MAFEHLCQPWRKCLVVKILGKSIGFLPMHEKMRSRWKLEGNFNLIVIKNRYFMVTFGMEVDRDKEVNGEPWMIFDHYLTILPWDPYFLTLESKADKILA